MEHFIYQSVEEMTRPETLASLVNRPITKVRVEPCQPVGWSSTESQFMAVKIDDEDYPPYVLKRMVSEQDWVMQMTDDRHWRAVTIWQHGLLDQLPEQIDHATIACTIDGDGYAFLMRNVTHALLDDRASLSEADGEFSLDAMAALHASFWNNPVVDNPVLNLCSPEHLFTHTAPGKIRQISANKPAPIYDMILEGWRSLPAFVDPDVLELLLGLSRDPLPLCKALLRYPQTLVHGDWRIANFGIERGENHRLVLLDWARPTVTAPTVDLAYYLVTGGEELPGSKEAAIASYRQHLARRLGRRFAEPWLPMLELSLLSALLMIGCFKSFFAAHAEDETDRARRQADLRWWSDQARAGARWLVSYAA
jgi:hypothetical protein